ncbi:GGDEF domain-containing protein [Robertmurraya yapensis]|uniref:GGDEF domain-containing protein n=1 Tax=Bacillus yapensis TaxID=2492960 RepID=A0A3S0IBB2_9BACI|nr:sensor domain-containing diguanylate cyclase [Bacillus yapensis]RTR29584.1 GGDEF domain-containing protein [Bacillus yapensis]TKS94930.1 diguanylate cyclase [Bacillus yapensis]
MEVLEKQLIANLKSRFFDLIDTEKGLLYYEQFLKEMLYAVKSFIGVDELTTFNCNHWSRELFIEASTNEELNTNKQFTLLYDEFQDYVSSKSIIHQPIPFKNFEQYELLIPLKRNQEVFGYLAFRGIANCNCSDALLVEIAKECCSFLHKARGLCDVIFEEKRYKQLFRVTEKFHSSMDMDAVLEEIIDTLQEVYPTFTYYLMLSHDNNSHKNLPIKDLEYDNENISAMQAYLTGTIQLEDSIQEKRSILYAPLKGKQGVYGVLQVIAPNAMTFPNREIEFITLLANTAGTAMENAQLYQQSRKLISDLQLINETSHRLNSNLRLSDTISFMTEHFQSSFDAEEVGFVLVSDDFEQWKVIKGSTSFFYSEGASAYLQYISNKIKNERDSIFLGDLNIEYLLTKFKSVMAVPMVQTEKIMGFALVMHRLPYHFSFETFKLMQSLIHHSTLAFTNSMLREELEKMVITDHLTKLHSRNFLTEKIQRSMSEDAFGTFILIDIDNFKQINDSYGHQVGDEVLVQVSSVLQDNIRDADIGARWGGEELALYLPKIQLDVAVVIAERLVRKVSELTHPPITISCGVSNWTKEHDDDNFTKLFKRADQALYVAKETGKNRVIVQEVIG